MSSESRGRWRTTSRVSENFNEGGLNTLTGQHPEYFGGYFLKESIDNSLEAAESADHDPVIQIYIEGARVRGRGIPYKARRIKVKDNASGISEAQVNKIFGDIDKLGGTKRYRNLATRGNQGNALMTILGIQYLSGGPLVLRSNGKKYEITAEKDEISREMHTEIDVSPIEDIGERR